jgi:hypothetical protein
MNEPRKSGAVSPDEFRRLRDIFEAPSSDPRPSAPDTSKAPARAMPP